MQGVPSRVRDSKGSILLAVFVLAGGSGLGLSPCRADRVRLSAFRSFTRMTGRSSTVSFGYQKCRESYNGSVVAQRGRPEL